LIVQNADGRWYLFGILHGYEVDRIEKDRSKFAKIFPINIWIEETIKNFTQNNLKWQN
jgi:hypothetical protein